MPISLETPVVTPVVESKTYDEVWLSEMSVQARDPNRPVSIHATISPARTLQDGSKELNQEAAVRVRIPDFFGEATEEDIALMVSIITKLKTKAGI
jgi:hypothetical protein